MSRGLVVGDLRVQPLARSGGRRSFTIVWPEGAIHEQADRFLQAYEGSGTQRTYAYLLLDHLRWFEREALACESARLRDLERYMAAASEDAARRRPPTAARDGHHGPRSPGSDLAGCPGEGLRIGELCGLHLADLPLRESAACGQCRSPHAHVCHREGNANRAAAKTKHPWRVEDGVVCGGLVKRVSPAMVHTYFEYMTSEYPSQAGHGMLLVQLHGPG